MSEQQATDRKVIAKYLIRGPDRGPGGPRFYFKVNRGWSGKWTEVAVVDGTEDPTEKYPIEDGRGTFGVRPILNMINRRQLAEIMADDQNMAVREVLTGGGMGDATKVDVPALLEEVKELREKNQQLQVVAELAKKDADEARAALAEVERAGAAALAKAKGRKPTV